jgi:thiamine transport system substrate-binding protein
LAFLESAPFQQELPLTLFVFPASERVAVPEVFSKYAVVPNNPYSMQTDRIAANRQQWQDQWNEIVLR